MNPAKPTAIKLLEGTFRKDRAKNEPIPEMGIPKCPKCLDRVARKEWKRISVYLDKMGLMAKVDMAILAAYCQAFSQFFQCSEYIKRRGGFGKYLEDKNSQTAQYTTLLNKATTQMIALAPKLGLSAGDRSRMDLPQRPDEEDPMESLLND